MAGKKTMKLVLNCTGQISSEDVYLGLMSAFKTNVQEIDFFVVVDGERIPVNVRVNDIVRQTAERLTPELNKQISE